jgi:uncharacterized membrane protein
MTAAKRGSRATSSGSRTTRSGNRSGKSKISITGSLYELLTMTFFGRVFLILLVCAILIGINLMLSGNRYDVFYVLCGVELIIAVVIGWLRLLLRPEA